MSRILSLLALQLAIGVALTPPVLAEEGERRTVPYVAVQGEAKTQTKPELGRLTVRVQTRAASLEAAVKAHAPRVAKASDVLAELKSKGVTVQEGSFTSTIEQPPRRPQPSEPAREPSPTFLPAVNTTSYQLEVSPVDAVDGIVDALARTGVLQVDAVSYALRDPKAEANKARGLAMRDAADQARVYAEAGGFRLVEIVAVRDGQAQVEQNTWQADMPVRMAGRGGDGGYGGSAEARVQVRASAPATIDTTASVHVTWRIDGRTKDDDTSGTPRP